MIEPPELELVWPADLCVQEVRACSPLAGRHTSDGAPDLLMAEAFHRLDWATSAELLLPNVRAQYVS
jgi:hypothetical protein